MTHMTLQAVRQLIANDSYAITFQSLGQYRTALLRHFDSLTALPTASPELPDLDRLEALAKAMLNAPTAIKAEVAQQEFHEAATPAAVLALIALARRAQPEGEAPQADLSDRWHSLTCDGTCSPPCKDAPAAQQAESGALPPLPEAAVFDKQPHGRRIGYTAGQMQEYARAALAAQYQGAQPVPGDAMAAFRKWHQDVGDQDCEYTWLQAWTAASLAAKAEAPAVVFTNDGAQPEDTAHLDCTACGGSGHVDDQRRAQQAAAPANTLLDSHINYTANMLGSAPGTPEAPAKTEIGVHQVWDMAHQCWIDTDEDGYYAALDDDRRILWKRAAQLDGGQGEGEKS